MQASPEKGVAVIFFDRYVAWQLPKARINRTIRFNAGVLDKHHSCVGFPCTIDQQSNVAEKFGFSPRPFIKQATLNIDHK